MIGRPRMTLERSVAASPEEVWELWTTRDGIEAWWGPDGFTVSVHSLDLRPGGGLDYSMRATGDDQVDFMLKAGMPLETRHRIAFLEIDPPRLLTYTQMADFVPGVEPYKVHNKVELKADGAATRIVLTFDRMHDERWTELAVMGREGELGRLERLLAARA